MVDRLFLQIDPQDPKSLDTDQAPSLPQSPAPLLGKPYVDHDLMRPRPVFVSVENDRTLSMPASSTTRPEDRSTGGTAIHRKGKENHEYFPIGEVAFVLFSAGLFASVTWKYTRTDVALLPPTVPDDPRLGDPKHADTVPNSYLLVMAICVGVLLQSGWQSELSRICGWAEDSAVACEQENHGSAGPRRQPSSSAPSGGSATPSTTREHSGSEFLRTATHAIAIEDGEQKRKFQAGDNAYPSMARLNDAVSGEHLRPPHRYAKALVCFYFWGVILVAEALHFLFKLYVARERPCFYEMCNYDFATQACRLPTSSSTGGTSSSLHDRGAAPGPGAPGAYSWSEVRHIVSAHHSFPSGHATTAAAVATLVVLDSRSGPLQALVSLAALYVALSRLTDNKHDYADILCGMGLGVVTASLGYNYFVAKFAATTTPSISERTAEGRPAPLDEVIELEEKTSPFSGALLAGSGYSSGTDANSTTGLRNSQMTADSHKSTREQEIEMTTR
ncbi:unnamed protein product [Amoebophrya sp. A25]|nr:unnamed protein product [Amoebophrya sp. A25]|eukprot:GSA25T00013901001.1